MSDEKAILERLERLAAALERLAPPRAAPADFAVGRGVRVAGRPGALPAGARTSTACRSACSRASTAPPSSCSTTRAASPAGLPANNALLWGARGMGKSSLVKAAHAEVRRELGSERRKASADLKLVEIHREDIASLPRCLTHLRASPHRFIVFCDDLSFDKDDTSYKSLKAVLEGGIEGRPENVLFYATSNRRHLMPRDMMENERSTAINPSEAVEEKVSLSDRFGLWLGFHNATPGPVSRHGARLRRPPQAQDQGRGAGARGARVEMTRGARSGRVAWQFIQDLAGRLGQKLQT